MLKTILQIIQRRRRRILIYILLLFCFINFFHKRNLSDSYIGKDVAIILKAMPKSDRERLEYFLLEFVTWGGGGYVLFGEKPMALDVVDEKITPFKSFSDFKFAIIPRRIKAVRGYKTWRKYEKFFPMPKYAFFYEKLEEDPMFTLVNKNAFIQKVEQHKEDFKLILHRDVQGNELLKEGLNKPLISEVLCNHDGLIGTLLGYGRENAFLFHQRNQLGTEEEIIDFCEKHRFQSAWTDEEFEAFRVQFLNHSWIESYVTGSYMKDFRLMVLPGFAAVFDLPETQYLRNHYLQTKEKIIEFYKDKDFLEATLRILTSQDKIETSPSVENNPSDCYLHSGIYLIVSSILLFIPALLGRKLE